MIAVGQTENHQQNSPSEAHIDAINQVFALFRINYHNQYYSGFSDVELLNSAKRLWLNSLCKFSPDVILKGALRVIEESDYLPTLNRMIRACQGSYEEFGLVDSHAGYVEACRAPSPKALHKWSHPAVYHAGCASDWFFLASNSEKIAFPVFDRHYQLLCARVINGEQLAPPSVPALPEHSVTPLTREENQKRLEALRQQLEI